jgi:uridine phosphorylase
VVQQKENGSVIGTCGIYCGSNFDTAGVAWLLHIDHWNKGYGTELCGELLRFGFEDLRLRRITANCAVANHGSYRVMEHNGMRREATKLKSFWAQVDKEWIDEAEYAILAEDYFKTAQKSGVVKNAYPILEYDTAPYGVIRAGRHRGENDETLPPVCVMTFFGEVLRDFVDKYNAGAVNGYKSEMRGFPVYKARYKNTELCVIQAVVGSASAAMMTEFLVANGVKLIICCGGCGVLDDIPAGDVIVPIAALRDEGASYHYLPPERWIELDADVLTLIRDTLAGIGVPFVERKTWTTDGFLRETRDMVTYRKSEGCSVVEMECATITAVARYRGAKFGQLLYSGDTLADFDNYDEREWSRNSAREKLFAIALEVAVRAVNRNAEEL